MFWWNYSVLLLFRHNFVELFVWKWLSLWKQSCFIVNIQSSLVDALHSEFAVKYKYLDLHTCLLIYYWRETLFGALVSQVTAYRKCFICFLFSTNMKHKQDDDGVSCHIIVKAGGVMFLFVILSVIHFVCLSVGRSGCERRNGHRPIVVCKGNAWPSGSDQLLWCRCRISFSPSWTLKFCHSSAALSVTAYYTIYTVGHEITCHLILFHNFDKCFSKFCYCWTHQ